MSNEIRPTCCVCGQEVDDPISHDVWLSETAYQDGQVQKVGEQSQLPIKSGTDYIIVGQCCSDTITAAWDEFVRRIQCGGTDEE